MSIPFRPIEPFAVYSEPNAELWECKNEAGERAGIF